MTFLLNDMWHLIVSCSHYFHRDRLLPSMPSSSSSSKDSQKDLFVLCAKEDEEHLAKMLAAGVPNSLLDLNNFDEDTLARDGSEGAGGDDVSPQLCQI